MDQKTLERTKKGWNIWKGFFGPKISVLWAIFLAEPLPLPPKQKFVWQTKLAACIGGYHLHLENPDTFVIIQKIGSHMEKSGPFWNRLENWQSSGKSEQFWNHPKNWQSSGKKRTVLKSSGNWQSSVKIWTVLKSSGKLAVIWKNLDSFEIIRKIGNHLQNPDSFEIIWKIGNILEKCGQFLNNAKNWQSSGKIRTVLK